MKVLENVKIDPAEFLKVVIKTVVAVEKARVGATMVVDPIATEVGLADVVRRTVSFASTAVKELGFTSVIDV